MGIRRMTTGKGMTMDKRFSAVSTDVAYPMTIGPIGLADCGLADWPDQEGRDVLDVLRVVCVTARIDMAQTSPMLSTVSFRRSRVSRRTSTSRIGSEMTGLRPCCFYLSGSG